MIHQQNDICTCSGPCTSRDMKLAEPVRGERGTVLVCHEQDPELLPEDRRDAHISHFNNPLLGPPNSLGPADRFPESLKEYVLMVASLSHPSAIFWGVEPALLYNQAWNDAGGPRHGKSLSPNARKTLESVCQGGNLKRLHIGDLIDRGDSKSYQVLTSRLFDDDIGGQVGGALVQLLSYPRKHTGLAEDASDLTVARPCESKDRLAWSKSELEDAVNDVPIDEHPFFHRFAEMLPVGLAILDQSAQAIFVNQRFYDLTTHEGDDRSFTGWPQSIEPDDYERVMAAYREAFESQQELRTEFRAQGMKNPWRLLLLTPLGDENLQHVSLQQYGGFLCSVVDITSEKSAELAERKAASEARERKEQQERFIDMISHEIRNPLSALLHCSEDIQDAVRDPQNVDVASISQAVETINLCISHQRNIVDDVLSFSKLDASMLSLTPKSCGPMRQLGNSLKIFQAEFRKQKMGFEFCIDTSYDDLSISEVMVDLSRMGKTPSMRPPTAYADCWFLLRRPSLNQ